MKNREKPLYFQFLYDIIQPLQKSTCVDAKEGACLREVSGMGSAVKKHREEINQKGEKQ